MFARGSMLLLALAALAAGPALGGQVVVFQDGRSMEVVRVVPGDEFTTLELEGGGRLVVPAGRIARWSALPAAPEGQRGVPVPEPARGPDPARWRQAAGELADLIEGAADRHQLDPVLLAAVAHVESRFDPDAVSPKGASGVLQLMPATARRFGVSDVFDPAQNVNGGARYLSWLLDRFDGRTDLALAGYNAGEHAVDRYEGIPPYAETRDYVARVLEHADRLAGGR